MPSECDKMLAVKDRSQTIGEFLEWLQGRYVIAEYGKPTKGFNEETLWPANINIERLLADYFEIDLDKAEKEKRAILDSLRKTGT